MYKSSPHSKHSEGTEVGIVFNQLIIFARATSASFISGPVGIYHLKLLTQTFTVFQDVENQA